MLKAAPQDEEISYATTDLPHPEKRREARLEGRTTPMPACSEALAHLAREGLAASHPADI
jgi:hypothetical protein